MSTLYAARGGNTNSNLYTLNPATAVATAIGPTGFALTGLAVDPSTGTLYGATSNNSPGHVQALVTVNKITGAATYVGDFGVGTPMADIAFDTAGNLYGHNSLRGIYSINKSTGAATLIGNATVGSESGNAFEIDAAFKGYVLPDGTGTGNGIYMADMTTGALTQIAAFAAPGVHFHADCGAMSFGPAQDLWGVTTEGSSASGFLFIVNNDGTFTVIGDTGILNSDALAWDGGVKPNPWFAFTDMTDDFDACPVPNAIACSSPFGAIISTDAASEGPSSLRISPETNDSWITVSVPQTLPITSQWVYTSFALYVPDWSTFWDAGSAWDPELLNFGNAPYSAYGFLIVPDSPTTGHVESDNGDAFPLADGAWQAVEIAYNPNIGGTFPRGAIQVWINGSTTGIITHRAQRNITGLTFGDTSWGAGPSSPTGLTYYIDDFHWSLNGRIGPVTLGGFINPIDSGTELDACTCIPIGGPHPVNDFYSMLDDRVLHVAAPGVMSNDISPTTVSLNTGPSNGSLIFNSDGSFTYTPNPGFSGTDSFVYNGNGGTATVTITVTLIVARGVFGQGGGASHRAEA